MSIRETMQHAWTPVACWAAAMGGLSVAGVADAVKLALGLGAFAVASLLGIATQLVRWRIDIRKEMEAANKDSLSVQIADLSHQVAELAKARDEAEADAKEAQDHARQRTHDVLNAENRAALLIEDLTNQLVEMTKAYAALQRGQAIIHRAVESQPDKVAERVADVIVPVVTSLSGSHIHPAPPAET